MPVGDGGARVRLVVRPKAARRSTRPKAAPIRREGAARRAQDAGRARRGAGAMTCTGKVWPFRRGRPRSSYRMARGAAGCLPCRAAVGRARGGGSASVRWRLRGGRSGDGLSSSRKRSGRLRGRRPSGSELLPAWAAARDVIGRVGCGAVAEWRTLVCPSKIQNPRIRS